MESDRRSALKLVGGAALTAAALPILPLTAMALEDYSVSSVHQNFKRGTLQSLDATTRSFVIAWQDFSRVELKAADLVTNYGALRAGQVVDVKWFDYVDCLIAPTTPAVTARAESMAAQGARIDGIPSARGRIHLWSTTGMCTKVDHVTSTLSLINAPGGAPGTHLPDSGQVIPMPQIVTKAGKAALKVIKPGTPVTMVYSMRTAFNVTIFSLW